MTGRKTSQAVKDKISAALKARAARIAASRTAPPEAKLQPDRPKPGRSKPGSAAPVYKVLGLRPPVGASSDEKVECSDCKDVHPLRARTDWNGSYSNCPKCGFHVYTHAYED